jgi:acetyl esterase/lipase
MASPELQALLAALRAAPDAAGQTVEQLRQAMEQGASRYPVPGDVRRTPMQAGSVAVEWVVAPGADEGAVVLLLHGGGYYRGSIATHRELAGQMSRASGAAVLAATYRLAPEHKFPAPVEDALAVYRWLLRGGADARRLAVAGNSAGGGLALALLLALRAAGEPLPAAAVCLSPWVDLAQTGGSYGARAAEDPSLSKAYLDRAARDYLGGADPRTPLASPLYGDLAGLPPLLIQVGTAEVLLDDSIRLADKARAAGVDTTLEVWPEMFHVWHRHAQQLPEARQAIAAIGDFLRAVWTGAPAGAAEREARRKRG